MPQKHTFKTILAFFFVCFLLGAFSPIASAATKWYPGHYIFIGRNAVSGMYNEVGNIPAVRGVQRSYYWDDLEPRKNHYDFSIILSDLEYAAARGWKLIIQFQTRTFGKGLQSPRIPNYLKTAEYDGGFYFEIRRGKPGPTNALLGNTHLRDRFIALIHALAKATDEHPALAGVNMHESGIGEPAVDSLFLKNWNWHSYKEAYWQAILRIDQAMAEAFTQTPVAQYYGHGAAKNKEFESHMLSHGFGIGNPDTVLKYWYKTKADGSHFWFYYNYDMAARNHDAIPLMYAVQSPDYPKNEAFLGQRNTTEATFDLLRNGLKSHMVAWGVAWGENRYHWDYVKDFLRSVPSRFPGDPAGGLNSTCPALIAPCTSGNTTPPPTDALRSPYFSSPQTLPGTIRSDAFDKMVQNDREVSGEGETYHDTTDGNTFKASLRVLTDIPFPDIAITETSSTGYKVRSNQPGEWQEYTVNVDAQGEDSITILPEIEYTSPEGSDNALTLTLDGEVIASFDLAPTADWDTFATASAEPVTIDAGENKTLRVNIIRETNAFDFTSLTFTETTLDPPNTPELALIAREGAIADPEHLSEGTTPVFHDTNPSLVISSNTSGTLSFSSDECSFAPTSLSEGETTLTLVNDTPDDDGKRRMFTDCTITLTDESGQSDSLSVPDFTVTYASDIDRDGKVGLSDFSLLLSEFGSTVCGVPSDTNGDCKVDLSDFSKLLSEFGKRV